MPHVNMMTLNLHCMAEKDIPTKQQLIASTIADLDVDLVCLQEVAQHFDAPEVEEHIRLDNYAYTLQTLLKEMGYEYHLYYRPFKRAFQVLDEGLAFLSKTPMSLHEFKRISHTNDYQDWHSRYVLTYKATFGKTTLYIANTHFGWSDQNERHETQFDLALATIPNSESGLLLGDFNVTPDGKEYTHMMNQGLIDLFDVPEFRDLPTHYNASEASNIGMRIDYVMSTKPVEVLQRKRLFHQRRVSDHIGLFLTLNLK